MELLENSKLSEALNFIQKNIVKKAMNNPGRLFTVKEISNHYDVSENTARKYLKDLVSYKILGALKEGRTVNYIAMADIKDKL